MGLGEGMLKVIEASLAQENLSLARTDILLQLLHGYHRATPGGCPRLPGTSNNHKAWITPADNKP